MGIIAPLCGLGIEVLKFISSPAYEGGSHTLFGAYLGDISGITVFQLEQTHSWSSFFISTPLQLHDVAIPDFD